MTYPDNSILVDYMIDIYASRRTGDIRMLHNEPFKEELLELLYLEKEKELLFIFPSGQVPYGEPLKEELWPYFSSALRVIVIQYDSKKKEAITGFSIPLKIKQPVINIF